MGEVTSGIKAIEAEAEKILESARKRGNEILLKATEEASRIISTDLTMGEVKAECEEIVRKAKEEADRKVEDSRKKASKIKADAENKVNGIADRMVNIITGANSK